MAGDTQAAPPAPLAPPPAPAPAVLVPRHTLPTLVRERWVRFLPVVGLLIALLDVAFIAAVWAASETQGKALLLTLPILLLAGKEAGIPAGIAAGGDPVLVAANMIVADVAGTFLVFPLVHLLLDSFERRRGFLGRMLRGALRRAEKRRRLVDRYGVAGLYAFSIIPFAFNGPPIVAALGRLAGLRAIQVVPVLVAAIVTTSIGWAVVYGVGFQALENVNKWIPLGISLAIMLVMVGVGVVGALLDKSEDPAPP